MIDISTFILSLVSTGLATPVIAWGLLNRLIDNRLSRQLERYKAELQLHAVEHDVRFRELHARRAEALVELHEKLQDLSFALESYTAELEYSTEPNKDEKFRRVAEANDALVPMFLRNRIFMSQEMDDQVDSFLRDIRAAAREYRRRMSGQSHGGDSVDIEDRVEEKIKPMMHQLRHDIRVALGVETPDGSQHGVARYGSQARRP
jgi:hypothetical protein